jgi:hypothetical protein
MTMLPEEVDEGTGTLPEEVGEEHKKREIRVSFGPRRKEGVSRFPGPIPSSLGQNGVDWAQL